MRKSKFRHRLGAPGVGLSGEWPGGMNDYYIKENAIYARGT